jgi:hypothetical protein
MILTIEHPGGIVKQFIVGDDVEHRFESGNIIDGRNKFVAQIGGINFRT